MIWETSPLRPGGHESAASLNAHTQNLGPGFRLTLARPAETRHGGRRVKILSRRQALFQLEQPSSKSVLLHLEPQELTFTAVSHSLRDIAFDLFALVEQLSVDNALRNMILIGTDVF